MHNNLKPVKFLRVPIQGVYISGRAIPSEMSFTGKRRFFEDFFLKLDTYVNKKFRATCLYNDLFFAVLGYGYVSNFKKISSSIEILVLIFSCIVFVYNFKLLRMLDPIM